MALCDSSVLTGQEGSIEFRPPGTSVCARDFSAWGTDGTDSHITLECGADFRVNDVVFLTEEDGGNLDSAFTATTATFAADGAIVALGTFVAGSGYPVSLTDSPVSFTGGSGSGATGTVTTDGSGLVTAVVLTDGGSGYKSTDQLGISGTALTTGSGCIVEVETVTQGGGTATSYYVVGTGTDTDGNPWIELGTTEGGAAITVNGDGGTGTADNELPAHINIALADYYSVCGVRSFSIDISRDELDVTTLPCHDGGSVDDCSKLAAFRSTQSGYASATGSMEVYFTCDQANIANRLLGSSVLRNQSGARVKLYVCTVTTDGSVDDDKSLYIEAEINITGMSFSVNPDDPTTGTLNFSVTKMVSAFGLTA
jgi:hypothetical protein